MSKSRTNQQGSTLSLVIACTFVVIFLGIGFICMGLIVGGHRETQQATDSGSLNVSKNAILSPALPAMALTSDIGLAMTANLTAPPNANGSSYPSNMGTGVNLLNFNRLVAQAMLVALNADAENAGQSNAQAALNFVEASPQSVGAQLKSALSNNAQPSWACTDYTAITGNALKMLADQGAPQYQYSDFQVGYLNQRPSDDNAANVDMSAFNPKNRAYNASVLPISDYGNNTVDNFSQNTFVSGPNNISYLAGFTGMKAGNGGQALTFYAVPTNPGMQPHLESNTTFAQETSQPGAGSVFLPPNAFYVGATANLQGALTQNGKAGSAQAHVRSVSMIGTPNTPFAPAIPGGYIIIDNSAESPFSGTAPTTDNVAANELGTGILVDSKTGDFSYGPGPSDRRGNPTPNLIDQWQAYKHDSTNFTPNAAQDPPSVGIYNNQGVQVTPAEAGSIPYVPSLNPNSTVLCTDNNSSPPNGNSICISEASFPQSGGEDSFDTAYHPNSQPGGKLQTNLATASEQSQCEVLTLYGPTVPGGRFR